MASPFESWIDGAPVVQSTTESSGDFSKWVDGRPVLDPVVEAVITAITPATGQLAANGEQVFLRPLTPQSGDLTLSGQQPVVSQTSLVTPGAGALAASGQSLSYGALSTIVSGEYTGDGSSPRTFTSFGTVPNIVIVIGKDGSGLEVGAIKTGDMASGLSQPFLTNKASGDSARQNRILDLLPNGFTVGSDLNVTGRSYAYIIFPAGRPTVDSTRSFVAPGGITTKNSTIFVPSGGGTITAGSLFVSTDDCDATWMRPVADTVYTPGVSLIKAGRRIVRNSDGAIIAEVSKFNSGTSADGVGYIAGTFAGNTWHWEEYYLSLEGQSPDLIFYMADDATGSPGVPLTVAQPSNMPSVNADWAGIGYGQLVVFFASDGDTALHIFPNADGGGGTLLKGVTYRYTAWHDDEANTGVKLHTFTWTGTGALGTPPTLAGMDFMPAWAFVFANNGQAWSKDSASILTANLHARGFLDGSGDSFNAALASWNSGGVTLTANGDWNGNGVKYVGVFFAAESVITAALPQAGALAIEGQPAVVVPPPTVTSITPGTAEGLILTPSNPTRAQTRLITPGTGSLGVFETKAVKTKETHSPGPPAKTFHEQGDTGELTLTGQRPVLSRGVVPQTGALSADGQKPFVKPPEFPTFTETGSLAVEGQAPAQVVTVTPGTGALAADGRAAITDQSFPKFATVDGAELGLVGQQSVLEVSLAPETGELQAQTFDTEPTVLSNNTTITPQAGSLAVDGVSEDSTPTVAETTPLAPGTGSLTLNGQTPTVQESGGGSATITPGTGSLTLDGQRPVVPGPTPTPTASSGPAGASFGKKPSVLWPDRVCVVTARLVGPRGSLSARGVVDVDDLELLLLGAPPDILA